MSLNEQSSIYSIYRAGWKQVATTTIRPDYEDELKNATWTINKGYLTNGKLGSLHSYIIKKWYGEDVYRKMLDNGFIVEHMDGNKLNCQIENLCFLGRCENVAKGQTLDKYSFDKSYIALNLFKDFYTQLYQISISFNYPAILVCNGIEGAVIDLAYLLYNEDYEWVINDATHILLEYKKYKTFSPKKLNYVDYHIEGAYGKPCSIEKYEEYLYGNHGHTVFIMRKCHMLENWTLTNKRNFFHLRSKPQNDKLEDSKSIEV